MGMMNAQERRESVVRAAVTEFARQGFHGTSTEAIARRVGVSQPYLFRLFSNKKAIFVAASLRALDDTCRVLEDATRGLRGEKALRAVTDAYTRLAAEHPETLLMQLQTYLTVAAAEAADDREFGRTVRAGWARLWKTVHLPLGAEADTTAVLAHGILISALTAMGFPPEHTVRQAGRLPVLPPPHPAERAGARDRRTGAPVGRYGFGEE
ncbi:TetR/AcrR family transcriptional regulator [Streptomyces pimonensis]|uniref:TetR/AcrR family transcriptional regulator n=1 Tax=Streptomyces pimonensis TaxID=2860288 RepID=A0ABV4IXR6_9ACTN